jgi:hypothetical protein
VARLLARTGALTDVEQLGPFRIVERGKHHVRFEQLINGIPVALRNEITTTLDGDIDEIRLLLTDPARAPVGQPMTPAQATMLAINAYAPGAAADVELTNEPRLFYQDTAAGQPLELVYELTLRRPTASHSVVRINAITSGLEIRDTTLPVVDEFGFDIYVTDSGAPRRSSDPGARLLVSEGNASRRQEGASPE